MASFGDIFPLFLCENIIYLVLQWVFSFWIYSVRNCNNFTVYTVNCPIFVREVYTFVYYNVVHFQYSPLRGWGTFSKGTKICINGDIDTVNNSRTQHITQVQDRTLR